MFPHGSQDIPPGHSGAPRRLSMTRTEGVRRAPRTKTAPRRAMSRPEGRSVDWDHIKKLAEILPHPRRTSPPLFSHLDDTTADDVAGDNTVTVPSAPRSSRTASAPQLPYYSGDAQVAGDPRKNPVADYISPERFARQIRTIRAMINDILLRRTRLRHEYLLLESYREHFHKSLVAVMSAMDIQHAESPVQGPPTAKKSRKARRPRRKAGRSRSRVRSDSTRKADDFDSTSSNKSSKYDHTTPQPEEVARQPSSHAEPIAPMETSTASRTSQAPSTLLHLDEAVQANVGQHPDRSQPSESPQQLRSSTFDSYYRDYQAVHQQEQTIHESSNDLSNLEFLLEQRLSMVYSAMRSNNFADTLRTEMMRDDLSVSEVMSPTGSLSGIPPLLAEYYARQGEVGIMLERLEECEYTHEEGRAAREFLEERGDTLEVAEEDFERNHLERKQELQVELDDARQEAARLKSLCEAEGIDTDAHRTDAPSLYTGSVAFAEYDNDSEPEKIREVKHESATTQHDLAPNSRIGRWLKGMTSSLSFEGLENRIPDTDSDSSYDPLSVRPSGDRGQSP